MVILVALCIRKMDNFGHVPYRKFRYFSFLFPPSLTRQKVGEGSITLYYSK